MKARNKDFFRDLVIKKIALHKKSLVTKTEVLEMMEREVFQDLDFKRQVKETSFKLKLSQEQTETVIKHFLTTMAIQMTLVTRIRRRLGIYAFFLIEIKDSMSKIIYHDQSFYEKNFGKIFTKKIFSIFKY